MGWKRYFTLLVILFLNTLGMVLLVFKLKQNFVLEFLLMLFFLIISIVIITGVYNNKNWAWKLAIMYFLVYMINAFYLYMFTLRISSRFSLTTLLSAIGFLMASVSIKGQPEEEEIEIEPPKKAEVKSYSEKKKSKTEFKPGKFVASKTGSVYHAPKCDWAKKIKEKNRLWLKDKTEATSKGYKKHSCVK